MNCLLLAWLGWLAGGVSVQWRGSGSGICTMFYIYISASHVRIHCPLSKEFMELEVMRVFVQGTMDCDFTGAANGTNNNLIAANLFEKQRGDKDKRREWAECCVCAVGCRQQPLKQFTVIS